VWLLTLPASPLHADALKDAYKAFEKGEFEEAAQGFQAHTQKKPEDYDQLYNAGVALAQKGAHDEAISYFDRAMKTPDPQLKSRAAYNKGVAYAQQQRWGEAEAAFQDALSYDNDNRLTQENLQFVREQKKKQEQSEQSQAQQNPKQDQDQDQDQTKDAKSEPKQAENQSGQQQDGKSDPQQAENQSAQQNAQNQKQDGASDPKKKGSKQEQETVQQSGSRAEPSSQEETGQGKSSQEEKQNGLAQKDAQGEAQQKGAAMSPAEGDDASQARDQRVLTVKDLKKQEAEKLLRSVDDRIGTYILTPEQANTEGKSRNGKDW
jgi:Tfp pilus assembly protein PilF